MKKPIALLLSIIMICAMLGGCGIDSANILYPSTHAIHIAVGEFATETEREGMRLFAEKLALNSSSDLDISLYYTADPIGEMKSGKADIIYDSSENLTPHDSDFEIYASPFFFKDYEHMTMTLNSPTFASITADDYVESLSARQLAAVYGGSKMFLSSGDGIRSSADFAKHKVGFAGNKNTISVFDGLCGEAITLPNAFEYSWSANKGVDTIEVNTARLYHFSTMDISDSYLAQTSHAIECRWIFVSTGVYDSLEEGDRSALTEAAAFAVATIDENMQRAYRQTLESFLQYGMQTSRFSTEAMRRESKEALLANKEFIGRIDKARYDAVAGIIR